MIGFGAGGVFKLTRIRRFCIVIVLRFFWGWRRVCFLWGFLFDFTILTTLPIIVSSGLFWVLASVGAMILFLGVLLVQIILLFHWLPVIHEINPRPLEVASPATSLQTPKVVYPPHLFTTIHNCYPCSRISPVVTVLLQTPSSSHSLLSD